LASGPAIEPEQYVFVANTQLTGITGIRLEVLPDPSLPKQGPGRSSDGNFVLTQFRVAIAPADEKEQQNTPVILNRVIADYSQGGHPVTNTLDGVGQWGWGVAGAIGKPHVAIFECKEPFGFANGTTITCKLEQNYKHSRGVVFPLGRFRL